MSTNIKLKRSAVQGKTPETTDLDLGELAINTYDGKLFLKKDDGTEAIVDVTEKITDQELLDQIKDVDGSGSGIDADLLDGLNSDKFLRSDTSDTMNGDLTVTGDVEAANFNSTSDRNLKKDIVKIDHALDKVKSVNGYHFTYRNTEQKSIGVIAQEIEEVLPEAVSGEEGLKKVSYGNLVGLLIEAIKDQQEEIEDLRNCINNIKHKLIVKGDEDGD